MYLLVKLWYIWLIAFAGLRHFFTGGKWGSSTFLAFLLAFSFVATIRPPIFFPIAAINTVAAVAHSTGASLAKFVGWK
jgi:hypothetical protein